MKSKCCKSPIRADVQQSCRIDVETGGTIQWCDDFSDPEVDRASAYCERCGENVDISGV